MAQVSRLAAIGTWRRVPLGDCDYLAVRHAVAGQGRLARPPVRSGAASRCWTCSALFRLSGLRHNFPLMSCHTDDLVAPNAMRITMIGLFAMGQRCRSRSGQDRTVPVEADRFVGALSPRFAWQDRACRAARKGSSRSLLTCPELLVWSPLLSANGPRTAAHAPRMPICFDSAARQRQAPAFQMMPCLAPPADMVIFIPDPPDPAPKGWPGAPAGSDMPRAPSAVAGFLKHVALNACPSDRNTAADNHRLSGPSRSAFASGIEPMAQDLIGVVALRSDGQAS